MQRIMLKSKIHRATVTAADINYTGSITIDPLLLKKSDILPGERVQVVVIDNGQRFETYVISGKEGKGTICLNGAAARLVEIGDKIIIMSYVMVEENEAKIMKPKLIYVDEDNSIVQIN